MSQRGINFSLYWANTEWLLAHTQTAQDEFWILAHTASKNFKLCTQPHRIILNINLVFHALGIIYVDWDDEKNQKKYIMIV